MVELYARTNGELLFGPVIPDKTRLLVAAIARLLFVILMLPKGTNDIAPFVGGPIAGGEAF